VGCVQSLNLSLQDDNDRLRRDVVFFREKEASASNLLGNVSRLLSSASRNSLSQKYLNKLLKTLTAEEQLLLASVAQQSQL